MKKTNQFNSLFLRRSYWLLALVIVFSILSSPSWGQSFRDEDKDGLADIEEGLYKTNPNIRDTDGDGLDDYVELFISGTKAQSEFYPWMNRVLDLIPQEHSIHYPKVDKEKFNIDYTATKLRAAQTGIPTAEHAIDAEHFNNFTSYTTEFWFRLDENSNLNGNLVRFDFTGFPIQISLVEGNPQIDFYVSPLNYGSKSVTLEEDDGSKFFKKNADGKVDNTNWVHLAISSSVTSKAPYRTTVNIYATKITVNDYGTPEARIYKKNQSFGGATVAGGTDGKLVYGGKRSTAFNDGTNTSDALSVQLDELRVWNVALSEDEIVAGRNAYYRSLVKGAEPSRPKFIEKYKTYVGLGSPDDEFPDVYSELKPESDKQLTPEYPRLAYHMGFEPFGVTRIYGDIHQSAIEFKFEWEPVKRTVEVLTEKEGKVEALAEAAIPNMTEAELVIYNEALERYKQLLDFVVARIDHGLDMHPIGDSWFGYERITPLLYAYEWHNGYEVEQAFLEQFYVSRDHRVNFNKRIGQDLIDTTLTMFYSIEELRVELGEAYDYLTNAEEILKEKLVKAPEANASQEAREKFESDLRAAKIKFDEACDKRKILHDYLLSNARALQSKDIEDVGFFLWGSLGAVIDSFNKWYIGDSSTPGLLNGHKLTTKDFDVVANTTEGVYDPHLDPVDDATPVNVAGVNEIYPLMPVKQQNAEVNIGYLNSDVDGDKLPDWWEYQYLGNLLQSGEDDKDGTYFDNIYYLNGDGLKNYYEYLLGTHPTNPYSLDAEKREYNDGDYDLDGDGLTNAEEFAIGTDPKCKDTDNDGIGDAEEFLNGMNPVDFNDRGLNLALKTSGTDASFLELPAQARFGFPPVQMEEYNAFTLEVLVRPEAAAQNGILLRRVSVNSPYADCPEITSYEIGLENGAPYFRFTGEYTETAQQKWSENIIKAGSVLEVKDADDEPVWSRVTATYVKRTHTMKLYINGQLVAEKVLNNLGREPVMRKKNVSFTVRAGENFSGMLDDIRIWESERTQGQIAAAAESTLNGNEAGLIANYRFDDVDLPGRAAIAGSTDAAIRADSSIAPYYLFCADSAAAYREDSRNGWQNVAILKGDATTAVAVEAEDPMKVDSDGDGIPDYWELQNFGDLETANATSDWDGDGLTDLQEFLLGTDPKNKYSLDTNVVDGEYDADEDGLGLAGELLYGSDPTCKDTDNDGINDGDEVLQGTSPVNFADNGKRLALKTSGTDDSYANIPEDARFALAENFTIEAVVLPAAADASGILLRRVCLGATPAEDKVNYELGLANGVPYFTLTTEAGGVFTLNRIEGNAPLEIVDASGADVWNSVAAVYNRTSGTMSLYVNGRQVKRIAGVGVPAAVGSVTDVYVVRAGESFAGQMDELRVWNSVRTTAQLAATKESMLVGNEEGLVANYRFDDADLVGRAAIAGSDDAAIRGNITLAPYYLHCADSFLEYRQDWKEAEPWKHAAVLMGDATTVEVANAAPPVPVYTDEDGDGIPDSWELEHFGDLTTANATSDYDGDGLPDLYEYLLGGDPKNPNSLDPNGILTDGEFDSDGDGLSNMDELRNGCDPMNPDTDDDGVSDKVEIEIGSSPLHPMSVVVHKATGELVTESWDQIKNTDLLLYRPAQNLPRSLDAGAMTEAYYELPFADRFAVGAYRGDPAVGYKTYSGDFTLELWVKISAGDESGVIFETKASDTGYGWRLLLDNGTPKGEIFNTRNEVLAYVGGRSATGGATAATPPLAPNTWTHLALSWEPGNKVLTLRRDKLSLIASMPISYKVDFGATSEYARLYKNDGVYLDEFRFWTESRTNEQLEYWAERIIPAPLDWIISYTDRRIIGDLGDQYLVRRGYRLQAYYRFDDGGDTVEDFAHFQEEGYDLRLGGAVVSDSATVKVINGIDDIDGDGIPEWWVRRWELNKFPNAQDNLPNAGLVDVPGFHRDWRNWLVWNSDMTKIEGMYGSQFGVGYTPLGGRTNYDGSSIIPRGYYTYEVGYPEGRRVTDSNPLSQDMVYVTMHRYFYLTNPPSKASLEVDSILRAAVAAVIINGENVPLTSRSHGYTNTDIASFLKIGRNQIVVVWSRSSTEGPLYKIPLPKDPTKTVDYTRNYYNGAIDVSLVADGNVIIASGYQYPYDPRAVWYYRATADLPEGGRFGDVSTDDNGYTLNQGIRSTSLDAYAENYAIILDVDNDRVDVVAEYLLNTNPLKQDSDNNGIFDKDEDHDNDGLINEIELNLLGSDPLCKDTDNDGVSDADEVSALKDPLNFNDQNRRIALKTDGTAESYLELPLSSRFALNKFTIEAYVQPANENADGIILRRVVGTVDPAKPLINYELGMVGGKAYFKFTNKDGSTDGNMVVSGKALGVSNSDGQAIWSHVAATYDAANARITLYVNGENVASRAAQTSMVTTGPGMNFTRVGENFNGRIDEVRIWKTVRTAEEITANQTNTLVGNEEGLVAYYRFDDADLKARAAIAGSTDADIRADSAIAPYYLCCADSYVGSAMDWKNKWHNAARLQGTATTVAVTEDESPIGSREDSITTPEVGIYVFSVDNDTSTEAFIPAAAGGSYDVLSVSLKKLSTDPDGGEVAYKYFWLKTRSAEGYKAADFYYENGTLMNSEMGSQFDASELLSNESELSLEEYSQYLSAGDGIQLVVVAVSSSGNVSECAFSQVVTLKEDATGSAILQAPVLVSPISEQLGLPVGRALEVKVRNPNGEACMVHINWYRNMTLVKSTDKSIDAGEEIALTMDDVAKVQAGDVWSFKVWLSRSNGSGRSLAVPKGAEWIFMMVGNGFNQDLAEVTYPVAAPSKPTAVVVTPQQPDVNSTIIARASGSTCRGAAFNYYYRWFRRAADESTFEIAAGQTMPYWQSRLQPLYVGDELYCQVYAMNIYGAMSASTASNLVRICEEVSTGSGSNSYGIGLYEPNDSYVDARVIYPKTNWMSTTESVIQEHNFGTVEDKDWVWFIVPESTTNRQTLVSFETNTGVMYQRGHKMDMYNAPDTAFTLYKQGANGKPKEVKSFRDFVANDGSGDGTVMARFVDLALEPGIYYVEVYMEQRTSDYLGLPYYMHLSVREDHQNTAFMPEWDRTALTAGEPVAELLPENPSRLDQLEVKLNCSAIDANGKKVTDYYYLWYRNGFVVPFNGEQKVTDYQTAKYLLNCAVKDKTVIPSSMLREGDTWRCVVYPYTEEYGFADPAETATVTVGKGSWSMTFTTSKSFASGATVSNGDEQVTVGWENDATFGFDATFDAAAASLTVPNGDGTYVRQPLPYGMLYSLGLSNECPYLTRDIRTYGKTGSWFIVAELGDPKEDQCTEVTLNWNETTMPSSAAAGISITQMRRRSDGYFEAVAGTSRSLHIRDNGTIDSGSITLDTAAVNALQTDANGQKVAIFRVTIGAPDSMQVVTLEPGWNMVALPITPMNPDVNDIFSINGTRLYSGSIWEYRDKRYVAATTIVATRGYWIYSKVKATLNVYGTAENDVISLSEGWNIIGPVKDIDGFIATYRRNYPEVYSKIVRKEGGSERDLEIYLFDKETGGYKLATGADGDYHLEVGKGYWIKATEPVDLPVVETGK